MSHPQHTKFYPKIVTAIRLKPKEPEEEVVEELERITRIKVKCQRLLMYCRIGLAELSPAKAEPSKAPKP